MSLPLFALKDDFRRKFAVCETKDQNVKYLHLPCLNFGFFSISLKNGFHGLQARKSLEKEVLQHTTEFTEIIITKCLQYLEYIVILFPFEIRVS